MIYANNDPGFEEFRSNLREASNFNEALDALDAQTQKLGFTQVLFGYMPSQPIMPNGQWLPLKLNVRGFPKGWEEGWERFTTVDPYYRACFSRTLPIDWSDVQGNDKLSPLQRAACNYLDDFGLSRGITVPLHLPFGRFAVMSAIVDRSCHDWRQIRERAIGPAFQLMHIFTEAIHDRHLEEQIPATRPPRLTPREQECMRWASQGKTSSEIAVILNRSTETVRLHVKNSIAKLNATNRVQAVAHAIYFGAI